MKMKQAFLCAALCAPGLPITTSGQLIGQLDQGFTDGQWINTHQKLYRYDDQGHKIYEAEQAWDAGARAWATEQDNTWRYDTDGRIVSEKLVKYKPGKDTEMWLTNYTYTSEGRQDSIIWVGQQMELSSLYFSYSPEGCLSREEYYVSTSSIYSDIRYSDIRQYYRGPACSLDSIYSYSIDWGTGEIDHEERRLAEYAGDTLITSFWYKNASTGAWNYGFENKRLWDDAGRLVYSYNGYDEGGGPWQYFWQYDEAGQVLYYRAENYSFAAVSWMPEEEQEWLYNGPRLEKHIWRQWYNGHSPDSWDYVMVEEHHYDENGWLASNQEQITAWNKITYHHSIFDNYCDGKVKIETAYDGRLGDSAALPLNRSFFTYLDGLDCSGQGADVALRLFPNPATAQVQLEAPLLLTAKAKALVFSSSGQLVREIPLAYRAFQPVISLAGLPQGVYFIEVTDGEHRAVGKLLKI